MPERLYIAVDGPRQTRESDLELSSSVKDIFNQITWDCDVKTKYNTINLGCKNAVSSAITWFFEQEEMGIILEDDCLPDPSFFQFMEEMLRKYKDEERISMVSGDNFSFGKIQLKESYYFSRYNHIWGWGSWRRSWKDYDVNLSDYSSGLESIRSYLTPYEFYYWKNVFDSVKEGKIDTWDHQWTYTNFKLRRMSIMPNINLVSNLGFGENATHTTVSSSESAFANMKTEKLVFPLVHPSRMKINETADQFSRNTFLPPRRPFLVRLFLRLRRIFGL